MKFMNFLRGNVVGGAVINSSCITINGKSVSSQKTEQVSKVLSGLAPFEKLEVTGPFNVEWSGAVDTEVVLHAEEHVLDLMEVHSRGGVLVVSAKSGSFACNVMPTVVVRSPQVTSARVKGSGDISLQGLKQARFTAEVVGSGDIQAVGTVDALEVQVQGSGDFKGRKLQAATATLAVMGSGDIDVSVLGDVYARVMGSGDITVYGCRGQRNASVMGSGDISFE